MSLNDKELLELAAKAAGFEFDPDITDAWGRLYGSFKGDPKRKRYAWDPLSFDDDALRLAVKLRLDVLQKWEGAAFATNHRNGAKELTCDDPYAATRRAIVRAAAEIGKGMK